MRGHVFDPVKLEKRMSQRTFPAARCNIAMVRALVHVAASTVNCLFVYLILHQSICDYEQWERALAS